MEWPLNAFQHVGLIRPAFYNLEAPEEFLVKTKLDHTGLIPDHRSITAEGLYGADKFAAKLTLKRKTGPIKWVSTCIC